MELPGFELLAPQGWVCVCRRTGSGIVAGRRAPQPPLPVAPPPIKCVEFIRMLTDPLTQISFSVFENPGVYALLVGSGLSRAAEIPTGWEITQDLIRRIAKSQKVENQIDWASWYRETTGHEPDYSTLVSQVGGSPEERRSILHRYIEPSDQDREEGHKLPTAAHFAMADLVQTGYIRVIVTTNFDRLIENALRERGVEPTVIASADALKGAEPLTHTKCYLLKLHGDYKDARILNTDAELAAYPSDYDTLLDRIFDEHGLIVCGWSGEWDDALRAAILRIRSRRYSTYWAARGEPSDLAKMLIAHRTAKMVSINDADDFFSSIRDQVETLAQTSRQNPQSTELLLNSTKRFISKPEHRIQLDELVASEAQSLINSLDVGSFTAQDPWNAPEFQRRVKAYDAATERIAQMFGVLGRWGTGEELQNVVNVIASVQSHADKQRSGNVAWLDLRSYPAVLLVSAYGIGLVRSERWTALHQFLSERIEFVGASGLSRIVDELFLFAWEGGENRRWRNIEGLDRHKTALSDYLFGLFKIWATSFVGILPDFEQLYETWEVLASLAHGERNDLKEIQAVLSTTDGGRSFLFMPVGRSGWNVRVRKRILDRIQSQPMLQGLLDAGFGNGQEAYLSAISNNFLRNAGRVESSF